MQHISSVYFLLGVDSLKNVSGVQSGNLYPAKGMFWTWNSGYVMAKLEGNSPEAHTPAHAFSYHIVGYRPGLQTVRNIDLEILPQINFERNNAAVIIRADVYKWFSGKQAIKILENPFCHEPGNLAVEFANNYAEMFSVITQ